MTIDLWGPFLQWQWNALRHIVKRKSETGRAAFNYSSEQQKRELACQANDEWCLEEQCIYLSGTVSNILSGQSQNINRLAIKAKGHSIAAKGVTINYQVRVKVQVLVSPVTAGTESRQVQSWISRLSSQSWLACEEDPRTAWARAENKSSLTNSLQGACWVARACVVLCLRPPGHNRNPSTLAEATETNEMYSRGLFLHPLPSIFTLGSEVVPNLICLITRKKFKFGSSFPVPVHCLFYWALYWGSWKVTL